MFALSVIRYGNILAALSALSNSAGIQIIFSCCFKVILNVNKDIGRRALINTYWHIIFGRYRVLHEDAHD